MEYFNNIHKANKSISVFASKYFINLLPKVHKHIKNELYEVPDCHNKKEQWQACGRTLLGIRFPKISYNTKPNMLL